MTLPVLIQHNLDDIGLELTFSTEDHSFGRSRTIDLTPEGRNTTVTDETKARYVDLVCQHRMTSAIEKQITAFLEGWNEMVVSFKISHFICSISSTLAHLSCALIALFFILSLFFSRTLI